MRIALFSLVVFVTTSLSAGDVALVDNGQPKARHDDAARLATQFNLLASPLRKWRFQTDKDKPGEASGWAKADFDDSAWKTTDCLLDTWSALGLHNYMGSAWYRQRAKLPAIAEGTSAHFVRSGILSPASGERARMRGRTVPTPPFAVRPRLMTAARRRPSINSEAPLTLTLSPRCGRERGPEHESALSY